MDTLFRELATHIEALYYMFGKRTSNPSKNTYQSSSSVNKRPSYDMPTRDWEYFYTMNPNIGASSNYSPLSFNPFNAGQTYNPYHSSNYAQTYNPSKYWRNNSAHRVSFERSGEQHFQKYFFGINFISIQA